jgi:uncharacterized protein (TIGR03067 family)
MKPRLLLLAAAILAIFACSGKKGGSTELDGTWSAVSAEKDTKLTKGPSKDQFAHSKFTFAGDKFTLEAEEKKGEGTLKVYPDRNPKEIDLIGNQTMKGIYKLDGSELTLCLSAGPNATRPTAFSAKTGSHAILIVLQRE